MKSKINVCSLFTLPVIALVMSVILYGCGDEENKGTGVTGIPVSIFGIKESSASIPVKTSGKITADKEMRLSFKTGGIIEGIYANEGDFVQKGKILAEIDLQEINANVLQAKSALDKAERDFKRAEKLFADSVVTLEQYQNSKTALDVAKANFEIASFNKSLSTIKAPTNGRIYKKFAEIKEIVGPGTPIFHFGSSTGNWKIEAGLTDKDIKKVKKGDTADVYIDALPGKKFTAVISEIAGSIDPYSSTYKVELSLKDPSDRIISGMIAAVTIFSESDGIYKTIPIKSLVNADELRGEVFTLNESDSTVKSIPVVVKEIFNEMVIIESGLINVDFVILDGVEYMYDGAKVKVTNYNKNSGEIL